MTAPNLFTVSGKKRLSFMRGVNKPITLDVLEQPVRKSVQVLQPKIGKVRVQRDLLPRLNWRHLRVLDRQFWRVIQQPLEGVLWCLPRGSGGQRGMRAW